MPSGKALLPRAACKNFIRGDFRRLEVHGDGAIAPGILKLMAAIGDKSQFDAQFLRRFVEASRLIASLAANSSTRLPGDSDTSSVRSHEPVRRSYYIGVMARLFSR